MTRIIFVSEVSKLLNLNPYEKQYISKLCKRERLKHTGAIDVTLKPLVCESMPLKRNKLELQQYRCSTTHGVKNEYKVIQHLRATFNIINIQKTYREHLNTRIPFVIFGRIDDMIKVNNAEFLLEVEVRNSKFPGIRSHEYAQVMLYLHQSKLSVAIVAEHCCGKMNLYIVRRDQAYVDQVLEHLTTLINDCEP